MSGLFLRGKAGSPDYNIIIVVVYSDSHGVW